MSLSTLTNYAKNKIIESYLNKTVCDQYKIYDYISNGAYCFVFKAYKTDSNAKEKENSLSNSQKSFKSIKSKSSKKLKFAVKIEQKKRTFMYGCTLNREAKILRKLKLQRGFTKLYSFIQNSQENIMVTQLLGKSLKQLFLDHNMQFSLQTILLIGSQLVNRIEALHDQGYVHRDIKPSNICIDNNTQDILYLIDFGLANSYRKPDGSHIPFKSNVGYCGTQNYMSINSHSGYEQSRRDDLMGLFYVLLYLSKGKLPWSAKKGEDEDSRNYRIGQKKQSVSMEFVCNKLPDLFIKYYNYVYDLKFIEYPNYEYLKNLFKNELLKRASESNTKLKFDWQEQDKELIRQKTQCNRDYSQVSVDSRQSSVMTKKNIPNKGCLKKSSSVVMKNQKQNTLTNNNQQQIGQFGKQATIIPKKSTSTDVHNIEANQIRQSSIAKKKNEQAKRSNNNFTLSQVDSVQEFQSKLSSNLQQNQLNSNINNINNYDNYDNSNCENKQNQNSQLQEKQSQTEIDNQTLNSNQIVQKHENNNNSKSNFESILEQYEKKQQSYYASKSVKNFKFNNNNSQNTSNESSSILIVPKSEKEDNSSSPKKNKKKQQVIRENRFFRKEEIDQQTDFSRYNLSNSVNTEQEKTQQFFNQSTILSQKTKNKKVSQDSDKKQDEMISQAFSTKSNFGESVQSNKKNESQNKNIFNNITYVNTEPSNIEDKDDQIQEEDQEISISNKKINSMDFNYCSSLSSVQNNSQKQNKKNTQKINVEYQIQQLNSFNYNVKGINKLTNNKNYQHNKNKLISNK